MAATKEQSKAVSYVSTVREMRIPNRGGTPIRFQGGTFTTTDPDVMKRIESSGEYGKRIHRAPIAVAESSEPPPEGDPPPKDDDQSEDDSDGEGDAEKSAGLETTDAPPKAGRAGKPAKTGKAKK